MGIDLGGEVGYNVGTKGEGSSYPIMKGESMQLTEKQVAEMEAKVKAYDKMKAINKRSYERRNAWRTLMLKKAEKANIKVTEAEVDAYLKK